MKKKLDPYSHNDDWRELTQNFYGAFRRSKDMSEALKYSFSATVASKYPDWIDEGELSGLIAGECLMRIFRYSYGAVEAVIRSV